MDDLYNQQRIHALTQQSPQQSQADLLYSQRTAAMPPTDDVAAVRQKIRKRQAELMSLALDVQSSGQFMDATHSARLREMMGGVAAELAALRQQEREILGIRDPEPVPSPFDQWSDPMMRGNNRLDKQEESTRLMWEGRLGKPVPAYFRVHPLDRKWPALLRGTRR